MGKEITFKDIIQVINCQDNDPLMKEIRLSITNSAVLPNRIAFKRKYIGTID